MFDRIAGRYDLMNSVMTAGMHHRWRERAADLARVGPGDSALDVCCGTGDLALELAAGSGRADASWGSTSPRRCSSWRRPRPQEPARPVAWVQGNALELPFDDGEFDAATVGFGARNVVDLERGIAEMARVVRPGGRVVILEITTPQRPPLSWFYAVWFDRIVPLLGHARRRPATPTPTCPTRCAASRPPRARRAHARRRAARRALPAAGRRHHRDPRRDRHGMSTVDEVVLLGGERMPALMERVERPARARRARSDGSDAARAGVRHARRRRQAAAAAARADLRRGAKDEQDLVRAAAAVELIHMATLVHDDVVDDALLRRGRPTVFARDGRETATATGDFLFSRAFALLAANGDPEQVRVLSDACLALARGELAQRHDAYRLDVDERALPAALRAQDRAACSRPPAGSARWRPAGRPRRRRRSSPTAAGSASRSRCSTTCST